MIFHDATLREIATVHPTTIGELGGISGLGEKKLATYGEGVLEVLAETSPGGPSETSPAPASAPREAPASAPREAPASARPQAQAQAAPAPASRPAPARPQTPAAPAQQYGDPEFAWDEEPPEYE